MKLSARNHLHGKIISIERGAVNGIVHMQLNGGEKLCAMISMAAIDELALKAGQPACAVIKASSVMIGTECEG